VLIDAAASVTASPTDVEAAAVRAEDEGYDGFGVPETRHDAFTGLTLAARATTSIALRSGIAVAFARNPMSLAVLANDLALVSTGRFSLGLGSQVQAHIERRYAMPWSHPAARMEEFVSALRAIWDCWSTGSRLRVEGRFYRHTLMSDFFNPGPNPYGNPAVVLAAVGQRMTAVAGRVANGMICHSFTTEAYLRERTIPALLAARGNLEGFELSLPALVVLGSDEAERAVAEEAVRIQVAFYASTPAYRPVLELHGWGDLHERLYQMSRRQAWAEMGAAIDDDVLDAFAVSGTAAQVAAALRARFGDVINRISIYTSYPVPPNQLAQVHEGLRS
jgi:probable F420-dependent oxidoreductase